MCVRVYVRSFARPLYRFSARVRVSKRTNKRMRFHSAPLARHLHELHTFAAVAAAAASYTLNKLFE